MWRVPIVKGLDTVSMIRSRSSSHRFSSRVGFCGVGFGFGGAWFVGAVFGKCDCVVSCGVVVGDDDGGGD